MRGFRWVAQSATLVEHKDLIIMNKKSVRKGESLIVNGSFDKDDWFEGWKKGAPPHHAAISVLGGA